MFFLFVCLHSFLCTLKSLQFVRLVCCLHHVLSSLFVPHLNPYFQTHTVVSDEVPESWIAGVPTLLDDLGDESPESQARVSTTLQSLQNRSYRQRFCLTLLEESEDPVCVFVVHFSSSKIIIQRSSTDKVQGRTKNVEFVGSNLVRDSDGRSQGLRHLPAVLGRRRTILLPDPNSEQRFLDCLFPSFHYHF